MRRTIQLLIAAVAVQALLAVAGAPAQARETALSNYEPGTIVVKTSERKLYLVLGNGETRAYPVGVGKAGRSWTGRRLINAKYINPDWSPPAIIRRERPGIPDVIAGGTPNNPMGVAAMTLSGSQYAIHGTNNQSSIGHFVSYGCIRMHNRDIMDLFERVSVGTPVVVLH